MGFSDHQILTFIFLVVALVVSVNIIIVIKLKDRFSRKRKPQTIITPATGWVQKLNELILKTKNIDDEFLGSLEELLFTSDLGPSTVEYLLLRIREKLSRGELRDIQKIKYSLREEIEDIFNKSQKTLSLVPTSPEVIMVVGVNGVGKTTSIGKLAFYYKQKGKTVMLVGADTFRAAAQDQLEIWAKRVGVDFYTSHQTQDPAAVSFQGLQKAVSENKDLVIIDTAGRLHNKENLMEELKKVKRVLQKINPHAPHRVLLVIDGNSGQNALQQAKLFNEAIGITGLIVTKLDGTARGGAMVSISQELKINPEFVGVGEKPQDFQEFSSTDFIQELLKD